MSAPTCSECGQARYRHIPVETVDIIQGRVERKGWKCSTCGWWNWLDELTPEHPGPCDTHPIKDWGS